MLNQLVKIEELWYDHLRYSILKEKKPGLNEEKKDLNIVQIIASSKYLLELIDVEKQKIDDNKSEYHSTKNPIKKLKSATDIARSNSKINDYKLVFEMLEQLYLNKIEPSTKKELSEKLDCEVTEIPQFKDTLNVVFSGFTHRLHSNKKYEDLVKNDIVGIEKIGIYDGASHGSGFYGKPIKTSEPIQPEKTYLDNIVNHLVIK
jgi:hypothetical protein